MAGKTNPVAHVLDETGRAWAVEPQQAEAIQNEGFTPISATEAAQRYQAEKDLRWADELGTLGQGAAGLASGLSVGMSDAAAVKAGLMTPGQAEALSTTGAHKVGDVAGMVLPAVFSGGDTAIARALAGTPMGLIGEAGSLAERGLGRFLPEAGLWGGAAGETLRMAARGATEGALVNAAHQASQDIIQDKPLAAQSLLAAGADGALFGGLVGGLMGGAASALNSGVEAIQSRGLGQLVGSRRAGVALEHLNADMSAIGNREARALKLGTKVGDGDAFVEAVGQYTKALDDAGVRWGDDPNVIKRAMDKDIARHRLIAEDALQDMETASPFRKQTPPKVVEPEPATKYAPESFIQKATAYEDVRLSSQREATNKLIHDASEKSRIANALEQNRLAKEAPDTSMAGTFMSRLNKDFGHFYGGSAAQLDAEKIAASLAKRVAPADSWKAWGANRDWLAEQVAKSSGVKQDIYTTALNAFDDEFRLAASSAAPELFSKYAAATVSARVAEEVASGTAAKAVAKASSGNPLELNGADASTAAFGVIAGHPLGAAGIIAGKKIVGHVQEQLSPVIAEYAARSAIGSAAGAAQAQVSQQLNAALKKFMSGSVAAGTRTSAKTSKASKTVKYGTEDLARATDLAEQLTSAAHAAKVNDMAQAVSMAGHPELAQELASTYQRASNYVQANMPSARKYKKAGTLTKLPQPAQLDTKDMKFLRQLSGITNPVGTILNGLENGDISTDSMRAIKYVMPELHNDIVVKASQVAMEMKAEGKYLPADKTALLGIVLDAPIDTTLTPDFIGEVQASFGPPPEEPDGIGQGAPPAPQGPPMIDTNNFMTPAQQVMT